MKNKFLNNLSYAILVVLLCTANFAYAAAKIPPEMKTMIVKFSYAMIGIIVFSVIIYIGLSIYNKFFVLSQIKDYKLSRDSLRTPTDKDEAVLMFITKNRLK